MTRWLELIKARQAALVAEMLWLEEEADFPSPADTIKAWKDLTKRWQKIAIDWEATRSEETKQDG